ncbi:hypothetical protein GXM_03698 [Nostoc sphaeroides CCNUC1]|uniref:Uncharacterized protein n=1 Tax=Nostoc sphaeroides CCNUC1 TaxID=2653204 RepID=A0A5P8W0H9_9NOSO|nr:hypothetical protein GXM_03698 [Nostoc sphaeroides CCNUC1]
MVKQLYLQPTSDFSVPCNFIFLVVSPRNRAGGAGEENIFLGTSK